MTEKKCVIVIGPESSGSMLIAKICAHVLDVAPFGDWNAIGWITSETHKVCHRSLPYATPPRFPNVHQWIEENKPDFQIYFVVTTRDITISELSRFERWAKPFTQSRAESNQARNIMKSVMASGAPVFIWSYETFMFLQEEYLSSLYDFLGVQSNFIPDLKDANSLKVAKPNLIERYWVRTKVLFGKLKSRLDTRHAGS